MLFNSVEFGIFFLIVYSLYLVLDFRRQNWMLLAASLFFYGWWSWKFLALMVFTATMDYYIALWTAKTRNQTRRKQILVLSVILNLGVLGFFKYFNFFTENLIALLSGLGLRGDFFTLKVLLPVGISFYTFQSMSYVIDVYRRDIRACRSYPDFLLFLTFFPQLVAGPIQRAEDLLPQVTSPRRVEWRQAADGLALCLWGLFKKVVIADNLAVVVNAVYARESAPATHVLMAMYCFTYQIYADFSGYSDMARGLGRMLGFDIMINFNLPFFAKNPGDLWSRWHISLSTWLRDYLYIPLGGNRKGRLRTYWNLILTMVLGGLWHGAAWTYVIWGFFHGSLLAGHKFLAEQGWLDWSRHIPARVWSAIRIVFMFHMFALGLLIFRAQSVEQAASFLSSFAGPWVWDFQAVDYLKLYLFFASGIFVVEIIQYIRGIGIVFWRMPVFARAAFVSFFVCVAIISATANPLKAREFIYFQF